MYKLYFEDTELPMTCESLEDLAYGIGELQKTYLLKYPICAAINLGQFEVDFGLGANEGFVHIQVEPFDGEYYLSVGDPDAVGSINFYGCGGHTPFERTACIPFAAVRRAVLDFVAERRLPESIAWRNWDRQGVHDLPWLAS